MGGAVSSGRDNNELIDNLMSGNYIRTREVERVFRALDRADYMTPEFRDQAYKDLAWRDGPFHMSSPCIYSEVMEGLELKPGLSFLNVGSGTGYLSTLVGLILGASGISHGVELNPSVVDYANTKKSQFIENSPTLDEFDFCEPTFYAGNGLCLAPLQAFYDRVYCGAGCPDEYHTYFKQLIKVGGVLVMPFNDSLLQVKRTSATEWTTRSLLSVSFVTLRLPSKTEPPEPLRLDELRPPRLQILARSCIRNAMRGAMLRRHPELRERERKVPRKTAPRRITIPVRDAPDHHIIEGAQALHDLDRESGANEMNALLSLVLSMGHNRVAGALRFDPLDDHSDSSDENDSDSDDDEGGGSDGGSGNGGNGGNGGGGGGGGGGGNGGGGGGDGGHDWNLGPALGDDCRGVITFEFQNVRDNIDVNAPPNQPEPSIPDEVELFVSKDCASTSQLEAQEDSMEVEDHTETSEGKRGREGNDSVTQEKRLKLDNGNVETSFIEDPSTSTSNARSETPRTDELKHKPSCRTKLSNRYESKSRRNARKKADSDEDKRNSSDEQCKQEGDSSSSELCKQDSSSSTEACKDGNSTPEQGQTRRSKLDSGLGEEENSNESRERSPMSDDDDDDEDRRPYISDSDDEEGSDSSTPRLRRGGPDARRVKLSLAMKRGVRELPLPYALQKFVNYYRCFHF